MAEKHIVVQGAVCKCQFGQVPDTLKVRTHNKHYANDKDAKTKLIATTKEIGAVTFENNTFGNCTKMGNPPPPCKIMLTEWQGFYEKMQLSNDGKVVIEDSKAVCAVAGTPCIEIIDHGQRAEVSAQNFKNANRSIQQQINPLVDSESMYKKQMVYTTTGDSVK